MRFCLDEVHRIVKFIETKENSGLPEDEGREEWELLLNGYRIIIGLLKRSAGG